MVLPPVSQIVFYALAVMVLLELVFDRVQLFRLCVCQHLVHLVELVGLVPVLAVIEVLQRFLHCFRICRLLGSLFGGFVWTFFWSLLRSLLPSLGACPLPPSVFS